MLMTSSSAVTGPLLVNSDLIRMRLPYERPPLTKNNQSTVRIANYRRAKPITDVCITLARAVQLSAMRAGWVLPITRPVSVALVWVVPDHRRRDADGITPTLSACLDGLVRGGLLHDDKSEIVTHPHPLIIIEPKHRMELYIEITPYQLRAVQ